MENNYIYTPDKSHQEEFRCRVPLQDTEQVFVVDGKGEKMGLALGKGELDVKRYLELAEKLGCSVVLETKTIEGLTESVNWKNA